MAEPSKDTDQSMEDILQSIKRIIADEGDPAPATTGSDVLELTELLAEDAAVPELPAHDPFIPEETPPEVERISIDEIMAQPAHEPVAAAFEVLDEPEPEPAPKHVESFSEAASSHVPDNSDNEEHLISDETLAASVSALSALAKKPTPGFHASQSAVFRSGVTVEDLVIESLKPMLKEWLDDNLPSLVRTLVEKEIRRLSN